MVGLMVIYHGMIVTKIITLNQSIHPFDGKNTTKNMKQTVDIHP